MPRLCQQPTGDTRLILLPIVGGRVTTRPLPNVPHLLTFIRPSLLLQSHGSVAACCNMSLSFTTPHHQPTLENGCRHLDTRPGWTLSYQTQTIFPCDAPG